MGGSRRCCAVEETSSNVCSCCLGSSLITSYLLLLLYGGSALFRAHVRAHVRAGDGSTAEEVLEGLSVLTEACLQHGANVMLMTVLEVAQPEPRVEQQRTKLNGLIKQYVQEQRWSGAAQAGAAAANSTTSSSGSGATVQDAPSKQQGGASTPVSRRGAPRVVLFDLAAQLTWNGMDEETRWQMWDDGVHLTIDGYDLMGDLIVGALGPLVKQEIGSKAAVANGTAHGGASTNGVHERKKGL